ncbi:hypothetical protein PsAD2_03005 [Pseudovibrio axinellae]|uniref:DUF3150 domain-containing protein n=1 Tax=Pseudovibrio axinellae TaxID=989403 RepID=A0A165XFZ3_9HYPH|nr:hypothetical protein [Pseudovibrio axinellae]KZL17669.1 hypothetical protein PsAD2_03005 [Pseudovibrio axinellae]SER44294.1 hypothetical protein SAMN05421798_11077 [Pseudovibrio axinellae]
MNAITDIPSVSNTLASRAMLISLSISNWSGRKLDRKVTEEVNTSRGAASDAGRYNKQLLPKEALDAIHKKAGAIRNEFYARTLPWMDDGQRIMAANAFLAHSQWFANQRTGYDKLVEDFLKEYPDFVEQAKLNLKDMFNATDYPPVDVLRQKFGIEITVLNVPNSEDFRVSISEAQADQIRTQIEAKVTEASQNAVKDVYRRITESLTRMVERLNNYKPGNRVERAQGVFRNSLVENIRDLIEVMPALNITGDPELDRLAERLKDVTIYDANVLKTNANKRKDTAQEAQAILDSMSAFVA